MQDLACILFCFVASVTTFREARQLEIILSRQKAGRDLLVTFIARGYRLQSEFRVLLPNGSTLKTKYYVYQYSDPKNGKSFVIL